MSFLKAAGRQFGKGTGTRLTFRFPASCIREVSAARVTIMAFSDLGISFRFV
jgi:hypothetical protein